MPLQGSRLRRSSKLADSHSALVVQIEIKHASGRRIASPLGKSDHLEHAHGPIEPDGEDVARFDRVTGRGLAHAVDAHVARPYERGGTGSGFHQPRMPQPFVETLALHATPRREGIDLFPRVFFNAKTLLYSIAFSSREPVPT